MEVWSGTRSVFLAALIACSTHAAVAQELMRVRIGLASPSLPGAAARIANVMGLFAKNGLDATVLQMDNGSVAMMGLLSGSVDFTTASGADVVVSQSRGQQIVAVLSIYHGFAGQLVLSKSVVSARKITADAPTDTKVKVLDDLVLASSSATSPFTIALRSAAESVGAKIRIVYMSQPAMPAALSTGSIQGFISSSPYYARPVLDGTAVLWLSGPKGEFPSLATPANSMTLNTRADFARTHVDLVNRVRAVFTDFARAVVERPGEVKAAVAKLFPDLDPKTLDLLFKTESRGWEGGTVTVDDMVHEIAVVKSSGVPLPDVNKLEPRNMLLK